MIKLLYCFLLRAKAPRKIVEYNIQCGQVRIITNLPVEFGGGHLITRWSYRDEQKEKT